MKKKKPLISRSMEFHSTKQRPFSMTGSSIDFYDPDHSDEKEGYIIIGQSQQGRLIIVSYRERDNIVRLISARKATRTEQRSYEEG